MAAKEDHRPTAPNSWLWVKILDLEMPPTLGLISECRAEEIGVFCSSWHHFGNLPYLWVTVFLCGIAVAVLGSHCHPPMAVLANFFATPIELGLVIPYLGLGEYITGGPQFPLNSDALKTVLTGKATTEVLQSILHALLGWLVTMPFIMVALYLLFVPCFTFLVEKFGSGPRSPKRSLSPVELRVKITD